MSTELLLFAHICEVVSRAECSRRPSATGRAATTVARFRYTHRATQGPPSTVRPTWLLHSGCFGSRSSPETAPSGFGRSVVCAHPLPTLRGQAEPLHKERSRFVLMNASPVVTGLERVVGPTGPDVFGALPPTLTPRPFIGEFEPGWPRMLSAQFSLCDHVYAGSGESSTGRREGQEGFFFPALPELPVNYRRRSKRWVHRGRFVARA